MKNYELTNDQRLFVEEMLQPFTICQISNMEIRPLAVSIGLCELFGLESQAQARADINQTIYKSIHPDDTARVMNAILRFGAEDSRLDVVYRSKKQDGSGYRMLHLTGQQKDTADGIRLGHVWFTDEGDDTEDSRNTLGNGLSEEAPAGTSRSAGRYDYLTGLPNMICFLEDAEAGGKALLAQGSLPALLYINLSGMKSYNHRFGFSEGDRLLRSFGRLLSKTFQSKNCCHVSADRFAVFADQHDLENRLGRLFLEWQEAKTQMHLPVCVGIYAGQKEEDISAGMAFDRAKIACDAIKDAFSSSFNYYNNELDEELAKRQYVLENLERALSERWIQVYYQPIIRAINEHICDQEALARWIDPVKGFLSPAEFIPYLEDAGLIYKLDLYMLEEVLRHIGIEEAEGLYAVPRSINISRSDFDACDMVEEIRSRVDAAGVSRDKIRIEITESVIGSDFEFMRTQIERFQSLGFPVWMDDFGSGYSSLDVLQSIKFDLLKFDMGFMRKLDESSDGRIILTELMKMASALGVDTICEGVETEEQAHFLQEIGCSKLQGFLFAKPSPFETALEYYKSHRDTGYENPDETSYYQSICGLNLYDLSVVAREDQSTIRNAYTTLPMCIIEVDGERTRFARTNQSYRDFFMRFFGLDPSNLGPAFVESDAKFMNHVVKACCEQGVRTFYDEKMPDGSIIHSFARRIDTNPVSGITAVAIAVLSIREPSEGLMVEQILSVIEQFGEYIPGGFFIYRADKDEELLYANKAVYSIFGCDGFDDFKALTGFTFRGMVHPDDYGPISSSIKNQIRESQTDLDFVEYRIIRKDGETRWIEDYGHYIEYDEQDSLYYVFISDVTEKHEQAESDKALHYAVIEALTKAYDSVWLINDVETEKFELFRIDKELEHLMPANIAAKLDKFSQALLFYSNLVYEEDRQSFLEATTPENIVRNTENKLIYAVAFRRVFEDGIRHYKIEFTKLDLPDEKIGIVAGFKNVDEEVLREQKIQHSISQRDAINDVLIRTYDSAFIITDMQKEHFELYRADENAVHFIPSKEATKMEKFSDAFVNYSKLILEEDRAQFLRAVTPENIVKHTEDRMLYSVPFRRIFEDGVRYYQVEFAKLDIDNSIVHYIAGFRDVDEEVRKEQNE